MDRLMQLKYLAQILIVDTKTSTPFDSDFVSLLDKITLFVDDYGTNKDLFLKRIDEIYALRKAINFSNEDSLDYLKIQETVRGQVESLINTLIYYTLSTPTKKEKIR